MTAEYDRQAAPHPPEGDPVPYDPQPAGEQFDNHEPHRCGTPGRLDVDGVEWWACDPYPTWYRWADGRLLIKPPRTAWATS